MARDRYKALSVEQEDKKKEYAKNWYQNMFEEDKQKLKE